MKKYLLMMVCAITLCAGFASCSDDDDSVEKELIEKEKAAGKSNFEAIFFKNGSYDTSKLFKIGNTHIATVENGETPKNIYKRIIGSYGSDTYKDNQSMENGVVKGNYEFTNKDMGVTLKGNYEPNKEGYYATMTVKFNNGVSEIKFYTAEYSPNLTPFK